MAHGRARDGLARGRGAVEMGSMHAHAGAVAGVGRVVCEARRAERGTAELERLDLAWAAVFRNLNTTFSMSAWS